MATSNKRPLAVLPIRTLRKIGDYIIKVLKIVQLIGDNPGYFATPSPALATVTTHINDLQTAQTLAETRVAGSAAARDLAYDVVQDDLHGLLNYVQTIADNAADEPTAIAIINASGFDLKNKGVRVKPDLKAENGDVSGSVKLTAKSEDKRAAYQWQMSPDNTNWSDLEPTLQAKTFVDGLTPGNKVNFRYRAVVKSGPTSWSNSVLWIVQ